MVKLARRWPHTVGRCLREGRLKGVTVTGGISDGSYSLHALHLMPRDEVVRLYVEEKTTDLAEGGGGPRGPLLELERQPAPPLTW